MMEKKKPTLGYGTASAQGYGFQVLDGVYKQAFDGCDLPTLGVLLQRAKDRVAEIEASVPSDTDRKRLVRLRAKKRVLNYLIDRCERGLISKVAPDEDLPYKILRLTIEELEQEPPATRFAGDEKGGVCYTVADRITNDESYDSLTASGVRDNLKYGTIPELQDQYPDLNLPTSFRIGEWRQALPDLKEALRRWK